MTQYIDKDKVKAEIERRLKALNACHADRVAGYAGEISGLKRLLSFLDTLEVKEVNIAEMADDYYDALMKEAAVWMDEGTMGHCRLAYYNGCKDVLNKIQKGE